MTIPIDLLNAPRSRAARVPSDRRRAARPAQGRGRASRTTATRPGGRSPRPTHRAAVVVGVATVFCLVLVTFLVRIQVVDAARYVRHGESQRSVEVTLAGPRGSITDRSGEPLAISLPVKALVANPREVKDPDGVAAALAPVLGITEEKLAGSLATPDTGYVYLARQLDSTVAQRALGVVPEVDQGGVFLVDETSRVTAADDLAMSVVGRVEMASETPLWGIEKLYNDDLRGRAGEARRERGGDGSTIVGSERTITEARPGSSISLTLDKSMQYWAESVLAERVATVGGAGGTVIIGRPATGEVLAMASVANVDGVTAPSRLNLATRAYEPGSVMKLVTAAGVFEEGIVQPDTVIGGVASSIRLYDRTIHDSHSHKTQDMTVRSIIANSSNVGTIRLAQQLGKARLLDYLDRFGFGRTSSLGLPKEQAGVVKQEWNGTDIGSIPIGQSIMVTPVQLWSAYNAIANGGLYVAPRIVGEVVAPDGTRRVVRPPAPRRIISEAAAEKVTLALQDVVDDGTGKEFAIPGFNIAAKTGTAYEPVAGGGYGSGANRHYAASFVGFFPATDPQISIMVMIDDPQYPNHFGATAAGPVFDTLAREAVRRYGIAADAAPRRIGRAVRAPAAPYPTTTIAPVAVPAAEANEAAPVPAVEGATGGDG